MDVINALLGGLTFSIIWILISLLISPRADFIPAVIGGIAWFIGTLVLRYRWRDYLNK
jgi:hypothetical protein